MTVGSDSGERRALVLSLIATAVLGTGAVLWGILSGASVILFDGIYMLAGIVLVGVSLLAARAASTAPTPEFPFGRHGATPLAVGLQGAALLATLVYGAADAVSVILNGGSGAAAGSVVAYGVVSAVASGLVIVVLHRPARVSQLARAELVSWRAGALLSLMVAVGGLVAVVLDRRGSAAAASYVDPILVLIASASIAPMAIALLRQGIRELMEAAPAGELNEVIAAAAADAAVEYGLSKPIVRATRLGRRLYVEVDFLVRQGDWRVEDEDRVRRFIVDRLDSTDHEVWANVELSTDPTLIED